MSKQSDFDTEVLDKVIVETYDSNLDEFLELAKAFESNIREFQNLPNQAITNDRETTEHLAHKLQASCASLGFLQLSQTLKNLERSIQSKKLATAENLYTKARLEMTDAPERLRRFAIENYSK